MTIQAPPSPGLWSQTFGPTLFKLDLQVMEHHEGTGEILDDGRTRGPHYQQEEESEDSGPITHRQDGIDFRDNRTVSGSADTKVHVCCGCECLVVSYRLIVFPV